MAGQAIDPPHYTQAPVEAIAVIEEVLDRAQLSANDSFLLGQVLKYVLRAPYKGCFEDDTEKAANYAHRLVEGEWLKLPVPEKTCGECAGSALWHRRPVDDGTYSARCDFGVEFRSVGADDLESHPACHWFEKADR